VDRDEAAASLLGRIIVKFDDRADLARGSSTMSQVRLAISPARKPALTDKRTMTMFRLGVSAVGGVDEEVFYVSIR
jgi:hypothetical protein